MVEKNDIPGMEQQGEIIRNRIVDLFTDLKIPYELMHHEPVYNMEDVARVFGPDHNLGEDVKALLVRVYSTKHEYTFALAVWRGDRRMDWDNLAEICGAKKVKMAGPDEVKAVLGIEVGALTPLGYDKRLPVVFDTEITGFSDSYINPGIHNETIKLASGDLKKAVGVWAGGNVLYTASKPQ
jgi:prolyl-tRNA editing enzyme YbaK/EbsC (Cys-tRNA(Pro) deacylase)